MKNLLMIVVISMGFGMTACSSWCHHGGGECSMHSAKCTSCEHKCEKCKAASAECAMDGKAAPAAPAEAPKK